MKKRDISHWVKNQYTPGLLLFADSLEEGTFHYSYESYKIPALNYNGPPVKTISEKFIVNKFTSQPILFPKP